MKTRVNEIKETQGKVTSLKPLVLKSMNISHDVLLEGEQGFIPANENE